MKTLPISGIFTVEIEKVNEITYVDDGSEFIETINDIGCEPSGKLILRPVLLLGTIDPINLLRDAKKDNANLGLYHALSILNSHSIPEDLRDYKGILFPGTLRVASRNAFIPTLFFSHDINARWRASCHWLKDPITKDYILLKFKTAA